MPFVNNQLWLVGAAVVVAFLLTRKGVAESIAKGLAGAAEGAAVGTVKGVGQMVGIPDTNADQCTLDLAAGNYGAASFSCPAPRYLSNVIRGDDFAVKQQKFINAEKG